MKKNTAGAKASTNKKKIHISLDDLQKDFELMKRRKCNCSIHLTISYLLQSEKKTYKTGEYPSRKDV